MSLIVIVSALSSANATMITGARSNYALGRDLPLFGFLGGWHEEGSTPKAAFLLQSAVALGLVAFGAVARSGFEAMVAYTAPVFWTILLGTGAAVIAMRRQDPGTERPFRVPLYPLTPILFCSFAGYMLYSSLAYAGRGAILGLAVMLAGLPLLAISRSRRPSPAPTFRLMRCVMSPLKVLLASLLIVSPSGLVAQDSSGPTHAPDVHFVPTNMEVVRAMLTTAKVGKGDVVYDLGCGDGRIPITAIKKYGARSGVCVDIDPVRIKESRNNADTAGVASKMKFVNADLFQQDLSPATVVTLYLLPMLNVRLRPEAVPRAQARYPGGIQLVRHGRLEGRQHHERQAGGRVQQLRVLLGDPGRCGGHLEGDRGARRRLHRAAGAAVPAGEGHRRGR